MTDIGRSVVRTSQTLQAKDKLSQAVTVPLSECTTYQLHVLLTTSGWIYKILAPRQSAKGLTYRIGEEKVWYLAIATPFAQWPQEAVSWKNLLKLM